MCGGVGFTIKNIPDRDLIKYYSPELIDRFKTAGRIESFFWHKNAVLPVQGENGTELLLWGNKDDKVKLPRTGWARYESLKQGKWDYLSPIPVDIPVDCGYEKKVWFDLPQGTKGIIIQHKGQKTVYMLTEEASKDYENKTGHNRAPVGEKKNYRPERSAKSKIRFSLFSN